MGRPAKEIQGEDSQESKGPTKVKVKHFKNKNFGGGYTGKVPATSVNPEQIYDIVDLEKVKESLALEGIETEEIERF